jgi:hypothetical protein
MIMAICLVDVRQFVDLNLVDPNPVSEDMSGSQNEMLSALVPTS